MALTLPDSAATPSLAKRASVPKFSTPAKAVSEPKFSTPTPPLPQAPPAVPATIPFPPTYGGGTSSGSGGMGSGATGVAAPMSMPPMSNEQWLAQDDEYIDTEAQLKSEFENMIAQLARQRGDYEMDTNNAYKSMGWDQGNKGWNQQDKLTGYGNAFQNQQGDFASRGMLDSSLYGESLNDLTRGFEQQRDDVGGALERFLVGQQEATTQGTNAMENGRTAAQRQALARMAAQLGL